MSEPYKLYGTDFSLYTAKVRSYLLKKQIPFEEILSTIRVYKKFIVPRTGVSYIPVVQTPDDQVIQDTTVIIDELEKVFPEPSIYPLGPKQKLISLLLELYGDEWLVIPATHYRWNFPEFNQPFIFEQFGRAISPSLPRLARRWVGKKLGSRFKRFVPMLGVRPENQAVIETSFESLLDDLNRHFEQHDYLLGGRPSIADFGFIGPFAGHLTFDPYPGNILRTQAPAVIRWVERMTEVKEGMPASKKQEGGNHSEQPEEFLSDDKIPETLFPILRRVAGEQLPVILDTDNQLVEWRKLNPEKKIPRFIGEHSFTVEGVTQSRVILPYSLWMFQRPYEFYQQLTVPEKSHVDELLSPLGLVDAFKRPLKNRLVRVNNRIQFSE